jgi:hypothetical protein
MPSSTAKIPILGPDNKPVIPQGKQPGKKKVVAPVFTKKENATLEQRIEILNWFHANGKNQSATARHFDPIYPNLCLKQPLISAWVASEAKWRADYESHGGAAQKVKRTRQTQHPEVSEMLDLWVEQALAKDLLLSGEVLRQKWTAFADLVGVPEDERLNLSNGWLARFKARNGMREFKRHGEATSADPEEIGKERERMRITGARRAEYQQTRHSSYCARLRS